MVESWTITLTVYGGVIAAIIFLVATIIDKIKAWWRGKQLTQIQVAEQKNVTENSVIKPEVVKATGTLEAQKTDLSQQLAANTEKLKQNSSSIPPKPKNWIEIEEVLDEDDK